jgi:NAD(P)-dependent dehydrogenase (short-subunit alcohol dehydrogenase family)
MAASSHPIDFTKAINFASLRTKTVLITGGADGIGWGLTKAITQAGCVIVHLTSCKLDANDSTEFT